MYASTSFLLSLPLLSQGVNIHNIKPITGEYCDICGSAVLAVDFHKDKTPLPGKGNLVSYCIGDARSNSMSHKTSHDNCYNLHFSLLVPSLSFPSILSSQAAKPRWKAASCATTS